MLFRPIVCTTNPHYLHMVSGYIGVCHRYLIQTYIHTCCSSYDALTIHPNLGALYLSPVSMAWGRKRTRVS